MRALLLYRRADSPHARWAQTLCRALNEIGVEAVHEVTEGWMPAEFDSNASMRVRERMEWLCGGFTLVHAFGHRIALACADALEGRVPWIATLTTSHLTTDRIIRLGASGLLPPSVDLKLGHEFEQVLPPPIHAHLTRTEDFELRQEAPADAIYVGVEASHRSEAVDAAFAKVRQSQPNTRLIDLREPEQIGACDLFVLPPSAPEYSLLAMEAMGAGVPVLALESSPIGHSIEHGVNGFSLKSAENFADLLLNAVMLPTTLSSMRSSSTATVSEHHSPTQIASEWKRFVTKMGLIQ